MSISKLKRALNLKIQIVRQFTYSEMMLLEPRKGFPTFEYLLFSSCAIPFPTPQPNPKPTPHPAPNPKPTWKPGIPGPKPTPGVKQIFCVRFYEA